MSLRPVRIVAYDPEWPRVFSRLSTVIRAQLGDLALAIEHVGSTAVPGLAGKPIIDLDVVIESRGQLPAVIQCLGILGYFHEGDRGIEGREAFGREGDDVPRDGRTPMWPEHHLYVCPRDSRALAEHLAFRNYLRTNPPAAREYERLKTELARRYKYDRDAYTEGKTEFVRKILKEALH